MREVTPSEARVIGHLLDAPGEGGRGATLYAGLPRSTFVVARRRLYAEGWVYDRYVPNPSLLGLRYARVALARPFADRVDELVALWKRTPGTVLLWRHPEVVLAVFLRPTSPKAGTEGVPGERELVSRLHVVEGDPAAALVPVYFDFSALWSRVAGTSAPAHYPRALGGPAHRTPEMERWAAGGTFPYHLRELLSRTSPEVQAEGGPPKHRLGPFGLPRSRLKLLALGFVERRVLPNVTRIPPVAGYPMTRLFLLHGLLPPERRPSELFHDLLSKARIHPFLFASDGQHVIVGALAGEGPAPSRTNAGDRVPLLALLPLHLREVETSWGELSQLETPVDHDYTHLELPGPRGPPAPPAAPRPLERRKGTDRPPPSRPPS